MSSDLRVADVLEISLLPDELYMIARLYPSPAKK